MSVVAIWWCRGSKKPPRGYFQNVFFFFTVLTPRSFAQPFPNTHTLTPVLHFYIRSAQLTPPRHGKSQSNYIKYYIYIYIWVYVCCMYALCTRFINTPGALLVVWSHRTSRKILGTALPPTFGCPLLYIIIPNRQLYLRRRRHYYVTYNSYSITFYYTA